MNSSFIRFFENTVAIFRFLTYNYIESGIEASKKSLSAYMEEW